MAGHRQGGYRILKQRGALSFVEILSPSPALSCSASVSFSERVIQARRFPNGVEVVSRAEPGAF